MKSPPMILSAGRSNNLLCFVSKRRASGHQQDKVLRLLFLPQSLECNVQKVIVTGDALNNTYIPSTYKE